MTGLRYMEQPNKVNNFLEINNKLQILLIKNRPDLKPMDWINQYAERFSEIIKNENVLSKINKAQTLESIVPDIENILYNDTYHMPGSDSDAI